VKSQLTYNSSQDTTSLACPVVAICVIWRLQMIKFYYDDCISRHQTYLFSKISLPLLKLFCVSVLYSNSFSFLSLQWLTKNINKKVEKYILANGTIVTGTDYIHSNIWFLHIYGEYYMIVQIKHLWQTFQLHPQRSFIPILQRWWSMIQSIHLVHPPIQILITFS